MPLFDGFVKKIYMLHNIDRSSVCLMVAGFFWPPFIGGDSRLPRRAGPLPGRGRLAVRFPVPLRRRGAPRMRGRVRPPGRALVLGAEPPERHPQAVEDLPGYEAVQG